jgi:hypothetical protein
MPRKCVICDHSNVSEINQALVGGGAYRSIAKRFSTSPSAVYRHQQDHLPSTMVKAKAAAEILDADSLVAHLQSLREETLEVLAESKQSGDLATMLKAIARAENQLRLGAEMLGQLRSKLDLNVRVIRSIEDLSDEELDVIMRAAEAEQAKQERTTAVLPASNALDQSGMSEADPSTKQRA